MKFIFFIVKIIFSLALVIFFMSKIDYESMKSAIEITNVVKALIVGVLIVLLQACMGGVRLPFILRLYNHTIDMVTGIRIWLIGSFFSQTMISFVGGDAIRVWCLNRRLISKRTAASAILLDRVVGFLALILFFLMLLPFLLDNVMPITMRYGIILLAAMSVGIIVLFLLLGAVPSHLKQRKWIGLFFELGSNSRYLFLSFKKTTIAFLLSAGIQLLNTYAIYEIFHIYHADVTFFWCLILTAPIMLISMLPISIAGWGTRETAMIMGFSLLGISEDIILAVSITFGVAVFVGGLPGMLLFLFEQNRAQPRALEKKLCN